MRISTRTTKQLGLLAVIPLMVSLTSCSGTVKLGESNANLTNTKVTEGGREAIYPNDDPSIPDGKLVYEAQNCAQCHGATGSGGSSKIDFASKEWARQQKPVDEFMFLAYGKDNHKALSGSLSTRQIWNLIFYVRAMADPPMSNDEYMLVDSTFGSNCAVCHGKKGYGDGPLAHSLEPSPANFQQFDRFYDRSDAVLWDHIANGIKWEGMPNFRGKTDRAKKVKFDDDYIWRLVNYVRRFHSSNEATVAANPTATETGAASSPDKSTTK